MRTVLVLSLVLAAMAVPAPAAAGACVPSCDVQAHILAFAPPTTFVESGTTVTWHAMDMIHTATDRSSYCFDAPFNVGQPGSAYFAVVDGKLFAASEGDPLKECTAAFALPDGGFSLEYTCLYHPNMDATLVVR